MRKASKDNTKPHLKRITLPMDVNDERISEKKRYLAKIDKRWEIGTFSKAWYGWLFYHGWTSHQVSYQGKNGGMDRSWKALYEIT